MPHLLKNWRIATNPFKSSWFLTGDWVWDRPDKPVWHGVRLDLAEAEQNKNYDMFENLVLGEIDLNYLTEPKAVKKETELIEGIIEKFAKRVKKPQREPEETSCSIPFEDEESWDTDRNWLATIGAGPHIPSGWNYLG